jgi:hypothetical protein
MRGPGLLACVLVVLAVAPAAAPTAVGGVPGAGGHATADLADAPFQTGRIQADGVLLRVDVDADGDASWTVEYRIRLVDDNRTAAFESLRRDVRRNGSRYRDQFADRMRRTTAAAENATGREMAVRNVSASAGTQQLGRGYGVVSYRFEWTGFARVDGDRVVVGDALAGLFLDAGTSLVVVPPDEYEVDAVEPEPDRVRERAVTWEGPADFGTGEPRVRTSPAGGGPATATAAAAVALVAAAAGVAWWRRSSGAPGAPGAESGADGERDAPAGTGAGAGPDPGVGATAADGSGVAAGDADADADADATSASASGTGSAPGAASASAPGAAGGGEADADATSEPSAPGPADGTDGGSDDGDGESGSDDGRVPLELLSPEERVMRLVRDRGGRMKQQEVVSELDWSAARTSQVVSGLREDGALETFRLGRENVLKLPEDGDETA